MSGHALRARGEPSVSSTRRGSPRSASATRGRCCSRRLPADASASRRARPAAAPTSARLTAAGRRRCRRSARPTAAAATAADGPSCRKGACATTARAPTMHTMRRRAPSRSSSPMSRRRRSSTRWLPVPRRARAATRRAGRGALRRAEVKTEPGRAPARCARCRRPPRRRRLFPGAPRRPEAPRGAEAHVGQFPDGVRHQRLGLLGRWKKG